jgi:FecR protein
MKHTRSLLNGLVALAVSLATISTLSAADMPKQFGAKVVRVFGNARYHSGDNNWQPLMVGQVLQSGAVIETGGVTGDNGYVDIVMGEVTTFGIPPRNASGGAPTYMPTPPAGAGKAAQNSLRIKAGSIIAIDKLNFSDTGGPEPTTEIKLDLKKGNILGSVKKLSAASSYDVKLPTGVAGIRGTTFAFSSDGTVQVASGVVTISYPGPGGTTRIVTLTAGQSANINVLIAVAITAALAQNATTAAAAAVAAGGTPAQQVAAAVTAAAAASGVTDPAAIAAAVTAAQNQIANLPAGADVQSAISAATVSALLPTAVGNAIPPGSEGAGAISTMVTAIVNAGQTPGPGASQAVQDAINTATAGMISPIDSTTLTAILTTVTSIVQTAVIQPAQNVNTTGTFIPSPGSGHI